MKGAFNSARKRTPGGIQRFACAHDDARLRFRAVLVQPARAFDPSLKQRAIEGVLEIPSAQQRHGLDDFQPAEVGRVAHRRSPVSADQRDMQQLRARLNQPHCAVAIIGADCSDQCLGQRVCVDALLQLGPVREAILASDHELSIAKTKGTSGQS